MNQCLSKRINNTERLFSTENSMILKRKVFIAMKDSSSSAKLRNSVLRIFSFDFYLIQPGHYSPCNRGLKFTCLYFLSRLAGTFFHIYPTLKHQSLNYLWIMLQNKLSATWIFEVLF